MMWHQTPKSFSLVYMYVIAVVGILHVRPGQALPAGPQSSTVHVHHAQQSRTASVSPPPPPPFPCDAILDIIDSYGTLEGTLGGAQILIPQLGQGSSEAGTIIRQFMTLLDSATLNVWALFDIVPCPRYQAPVGNEDADYEDEVALASLPERRQSGQEDGGPGPADLCTYLARVSDDVAQTSSLMTKLVQAKGLPPQLYIDPLQEAVDDAKVKVGTVATGLAPRSRC